MEHGYRKGSIFMYPHRVEYTCADGYALKGNQFRECQADGEWSGEKPSCERMTSRKHAQPKRSPKCSKNEPLFQQYVARIRTHLPTDAWRRSYPERLIHSERKSCFRAMLVSSCKDRDDVDANKTDSGADSCHLVPVSAR